jgi:hypothetical protein
MIIDDEWDGKYVHYSIEAGHSQAFRMACGITLSTWAGKNSKVKYEDRIKNDYVENSVGYSFDGYLVTCPECLKYMEQKLSLCNGDCGRRTPYTTCKYCLSYCQCGVVLLDDIAFKNSEERIKYEQHRKTCKRRVKATYEELITPKQMTKPTNWFIRFLSRLFQ